VKSAETEMVRANDAEWVRLPLVPVMGMVERDAGVPESTEIVAVEVTELPAGGVTGFDENAMWTPEGRDP
jgi:hypothetical protein